MDALPWARWYQCHSHGFGGGSHALGVHRLQPSFRAVLCVHTPHRGSRLGSHRGLHSPPVEQGGTPPSYHPLFIPDYYLTQCHRVHDCQAEGRSCPTYTLLTCNCRLGEYLGRTWGSIKTGEEAQECHTNEFSRSSPLSLPLANGMVRSASLQTDGKSVFGEPLTPPNRCFLVGTYWYAFNSQRIDCLPCLYQM